MTRPRIVTIGWTRSNPETGYSSFIDGYRPGAEQYIETLDLNTELTAEQIAEAVFVATNAPDRLDPSTVPGHIARVLENRGFDGSQSGHYSLSVGDTVTVDGVMLECKNLGFAPVNHTEKDS